MLGSLGRITSVAVVAALVSMFMGPMSAWAAFPPVTPPSETEPNGTYATANALPADGTIMTASYGTRSDDDWYQVDVVAGHSYVIETGPDLASLASNLDTLLDVYAADGATRLASDDDGGCSNFSRIGYTARADGMVYVLTRSYDYLYTGNYGIRVKDLSIPSGDWSSIGGVVTDTDTAALAGVRVTDMYLDPWFQSLAAGWLSPAGVATTGLDGTYAMPAESGAHSVEFVDPTGDHVGQTYAGGTLFSIDASTPKTDADAALDSIPKFASRVAFTVRASVDSAGAQGRDNQIPPSARGSREGYISSSGRYVVFYTGNGLVAEDTNGGVKDVGQDWYLKDMQSGRVSLVSVGDGAQSNSLRASETEGAAVSTDGRYVAFTDFSTNLVGGDTNREADIFYRDMLLGSTVRVSVDADGNQGTYGSRSPAISDDGRYVAFRTDSALVPNDTNDQPDIYVRDMVGGTIERVSVATDGTEAGADSDDVGMSTDGRYVVFRSGASNLVADDTNSQSDIFMHDMLTGETTRVSMTNDGQEANDSSFKPSVSADGRYVAFQSSAGNLVADDSNSNDDVFVRDIVAGTTTCVSVTGAGTLGAGAGSPDISADGRFVAFVAGANSSDSADPLNILPGDTNRAEDVFVRDMLSGSTTCASVAPTGHGPDDDSYDPQISADGQVVVYVSAATDVVSDDTNGAKDVFVASSLFDITSSAGTNGSISPDGPQVVPFGTDLRFTIAADTGYHVADVLVDGVSVGAVASYDFTNVVKNHTIEASFAIDTFTVTSSAGSNGSISPLGPQTVPYGGSQTFAITPNPGFHVLDVLVDDASVGAVMSYDCTNVKGNHTIAVSFARDADQRVAVYRLRHTRSGEYFYTASMAEATAAVWTSRSRFRLEGVAYVVNVANPSNNMPLHRFYNVRTGTHFYTISEAEKATLMTARAARAWRYEGIAYRVASASGAPVHRFLNRRTGGHFYTASEGEKAQVQKVHRSTFLYEGVAFRLAP